MKRLIFLINILAWVFFCCYYYNYYYTPVMIGIFTNIFIPITTSLLYLLFWLSILFFWTVNPIAPSATPVAPPQSSQPTSEPTSPTLLSSASASSFANIAQFAYTGSYETWTVPADGSYYIVAAGAQGGTSIGNVFFFFFVNL